MAEEQNTFNYYLKETLLSLTILSIAVILYVLLIYKGGQFYNPGFVNLWIMIPFVLFLTPYLILRLFEIKAVDAKMEHIPRLLRDIVDNVESGRDLISSIKDAPRSEYGSLNLDIKKLANQLSWGIPFDEALINFAKNVGSKDLLRDFLLVIKARNVGGHVEKILRELSLKIQTEILRNKKRKSNLASNTFTGYISFVIFLVIIIIVYSSLFVGSLGSTPGSAVDQTLHGYLTLFTLLSYELAILSGFLFGIMQSNNWINGAPHVVILVVAVFLGFFIFI